MSEYRQVQQEDLRELLATQDTDTLLNLLREQAERYFGGHYTILSFTTHFKVAFGTPALDLVGYDAIAALPGFSTVKGAIIDALVRVRTFYQDAERNEITRELLERLSRPR